MTSSSELKKQPQTPTIEWDRIVGKSVKTVDYQNVGKVVTAFENEDEIIISSKGANGNYNYRVPKAHIQSFDGLTLMLSIARTEIPDYEINDIQEHAAQLRSIKTEKKGEGEEIVVPVVEEKLNVSKKIITDEAIIIKEPMMEIKIIEVPLMHEELVIEKRPHSTTEGSSSTSEDPPPTGTRTEIRIPLISEEAKIRKEPYVKQEILIGKKPITEIKAVNVSVSSEKVKTNNNKLVGPAP